MDQALAELAVSPKKKPAAQVLKKPSAKVVAKPDPEAQQKKPENTEKPENTDKTLEEKAGFSIFLYSEFFRQYTGRIFYCIHLYKARFY